MLNSKIMKEISIDNLCSFESILVTKHNAKQNLGESYTNKYQKHVGCSYGYNLIYVDNKVSKSFKSYLGRYSI